MKKMFTTILSFEIFFEIFKFMHSHIQAQSHLTNVEYYFGAKDSGSLWDIPCGYFRINATKNQVASLAKEMLILQPLGEATSEDEKTEYVVMIVSITGLYEKYGIVLNQKGQLGALTQNVKKVNLEINQLTNVILLFPMNLSLRVPKLMQTTYDFGSLAYTKEGEVFIPYAQWEKVIDDVRD